MSVKAVTVSILSVGSTCSAVTAGYIYLKKGDFGNAYGDSLESHKISLDTSDDFQPSSAQTIKENIDDQEGPKKSEIEQDNKLTYSHGNECSLWRFYRCIRVISPSIFSN